MKSKLVVGNWKMNGSLEANRALLTALAGRGFEGVEACVCVPFPYLAQVLGLIESSPLLLGAQDVCEYAEGAYTGEVSAAMLREFDCRYVIVGHSERRALFGEDDALVARKAAAALNAGITPIVCVGESLAERDAGRLEPVLERQLDALEAGLGRSRLAELVLAYEPVWAIGTGRSASAVQVQQALAFVRGWLSARQTGARILYGGSVKADSAIELFALPDCDGGLIGGASLVAAEFLAICEAAGAVSRSR
ncbi:MAG TPA: triose-phosphate isomerase [Rhodocyclaceae bacterium]|nr:triose-phosphate isomerase [Rhodocyclaceae bacterium]